MNAVSTYRWRVWMVALLVMVIVAGCKRTPEPGPGEDLGDSTLRLTSSAFEDGEMIPTIYTCDGEDMSPPLSWRGAPEGTRTLVLIVDDPDAPLRTWVHWVVYNIPVDLEGFPEGMPSEPELASGVQQGQTSWSRSGYGGPCPPSGTHHYIFTLYALDTSLDLAPARTDKQAVINEIETHVLARATLTGLYGR